MSLIAGNLGIIQRLLDEQQLIWGVYGGAASHYYGNRRPIRNIDILVAPGTLSKVSQVMKEAKRVVQFDGRRIMWSGINLCDDLTIRRTGNSHTLKMDQPMIDRLRRLPLLGSRIAMLAPEDVLVHKMLQERSGQDADKDSDDAESVAKRQQLDIEYLTQRLRLANALDLLKPQLEEYGVVFG